MVKLREILDYCWTLAPEGLQESWDNVGLLCGRRDAEISRVLVALDPTEVTAREAVETGAQLLLTHHPLMFSLKAVSDETAAGRTLLYLAEHGVAAVALHTNLDSARGGVNDCLAGLLGLSEPVPLCPSASNPGAGLGRIGTIPPVHLPVFVEFVRQQLDCQGLRYADAGRPVSRVAVGGGACMDCLPQVVAAGCDTFVTGDVKYHQFMDAVNQGVNLIDAGHFETENPVCGWLCDRLRAQFPALSVQLSEKHCDLIQFACANG